MRTMGGWAWRLGGGVAVLWLLGVAFLPPISMNSSRSEGIEDDRISQRLKRAVLELDVLKKKNEDIRNALHDFTKQMSGLRPNSLQAEASDPALVADLQAKLEHAQRMLQQVDSTGDRQLGGNDFVPTLEFEQTRRLVDSGIQELWWYISAQLKGLKKKYGASSKESSPIDKILKNGADHVRILKHDFDHLSNLDGLGSWRQREATELSDLVQNRLSHLQNPEDCSKARKLVCSLNKGCGYGCQIHHVVYCFIMAYGTKRTLILRSKNWRYNKGGWEDVFYPVSETCLDASGASHVHWPGPEDTQVIDVPIIDTLSQRPPFLPLAIPKDISEQIIRLHGDPAAWWVGQFLKYLLKPQPKMKEFLETMEQKLGFKKPIVGLHVRRTDKVGTEAAFHPIEEYMSIVDDYFQKLQLDDPSVVKRVYVASDDPAVITEARTKSEEIELQAGDVIGIAGNHWDGYSKGLNRRTRQSGLFPSYKIEEIIDIAETASYSDVDKERT